MTKISNQKLPPKGVKWFHCEICKQTVPWENKHKRKHHNKK